jgi:hypothetical protein
MRLGSCPACEAKDADIAFLRGQVEKLQDRALGMADPLLEARLAQATRLAQPRPPEDPKAAEIRTHNLQKLRQQRGDRAIVDPDDRQPIPRKPRPTDAAAVEAAFEDVAR